MRARLGLSDTDIGDVVDQFRRFAVVVTPTVTLRAVPDDPDDDVFVECAVAGAADYIVTRDQHLLTLQAYDGIDILLPADFLGLLKAKQRADVEEE